MIWKQKLGSSATYNKLIRVFEHAGYKNYADNVRKIVTVYRNSETDDSSTSSEESFPLPQPQTYPLLKSLNPPSPTDTELPSHEPETYLLIDPAVAESLPEGENILL